MLDEFAHIGRTLHRKIVAHARRHHDLLDARKRARLAIELDQRVVAGVRDSCRCPDRRRTDAGTAPRSRLSLQAMRYMLAVGPPMSEMMPVKPSVLSRMISISRRIELLRARLDDAALVLGDRAEGAAAETAAHDRHRMADHLPGGNFRARHRRVRRAREGQVIDRVHLRRGQRNGRRRQPDVPVAVPLRQRPGVAGIALLVQHARGAGVGFRLVARPARRRAGG